MTQPEVIKKIFALLDEGYTVDEIAEIFEFSPAYVQACIDYEEHK